MRRAGRSRQIGSLVLAAVGIGVLVYLVLPIFIVVPMSFSASRFLAFPPPVVVGALVRRVFRKRGVDAARRW